MHNFDVKWPNFEFTWERERQGDKLFYLCLSSVMSLHFQPNFTIGRFYTRGRIIRPEA